jgi:hypothetical protein
MYAWQQVTGNEIDPFIKNVVLNNMKWFFDNPDSICFQPLNIEGLGPFPLDLHSLREGMIALNAVIKYEEGEWREWALETAEKMIATIDRALLPNMSWDFNQFYYNTVTNQRLGVDPCSTNGRFCEALLMYYELTQSQNALDLAQRIIDYHFANSTKADGTLNYASSPSHTHSYFNTLQAIFLYGKITGDNRYIERIVKTFDVTVLRLISESGVVTHDLESGGFGWESSSTSDAMQLAMWLVDMGYTKYADFVERMVRARLLPGQFFDGDKIKYNDNGASVSWNLKERVLGGFSMIFDSPYSGKHNTTDVTGHILQALCDVYNHIAYTTDDETYLVYHFDYQNDKISVESKREDKAEIKITIKDNTSLNVRIPSWATNVVVKVNGTQRTVQQDDIYAAIGQVNKDDVVVVTFDLPEKTTYETHINGVTYQLRWKGDEITGVSPNSNFMSYYHNN